MVDFISALRFGVHLPFRDSQEQRAAKAIANHFEYEYGGSTYSSVNEPVYIGTWKHKRKRYWAEECLLNIDVPFKPRDNLRLVREECIRKVLADIDEYAREMYDLFQRPQISFWLTVTEMRVASTG